MFSQTNARTNTHYISSNSLKSVKELSTKFFLSMSEFLPHTQIHVLSRFRLSSISKRPSDTASFPNYYSQSLQPTMTSHIKQHISYEGAGSLLNSYKKAKPEEPAEASVTMVTRHESAAQASGQQAATGNKQDVAVVDMGHLLLQSRVHWAREAGGGATGTGD